MEIACWYWQSRQLNRYADVDDDEIVTRGINGGTNGLPERKRYRLQAQSIWGAAGGANGVRCRPALRPGSRGEDVATLQKALNRLQPERKPLTVDGDFGGRTEAAVLAWQGGRGLKADAIVGRATWDSIDAALAALDPPDVEIPPAPPDPPPLAPDTPDRVEPQHAASGGFFHALMRRIFG